MLSRTTAQHKIRKLRKRIRIVRGGTSSSKTFSIIPMLIEYATTNINAEISVVAESIPHLKRGALRDFLKIMDMIGMYNDASFNKSSLVYKFSTGSFIEFFSADSPSKLRGARRDILFINECNNVSFESYYQLAIRTRKFIYLDYNPVSEFWVDTELIHDKDAEMIVLTYKDNEALEPAIVKEIEKARDKSASSSYWLNWWNVYGLGQIGTLEGVIFNNWQQCEAIPTDAEFISYGLDWGFTNDPTALIEVYRLNGELYINELLYQTRLTNQDIISRLKQIGVTNSQCIVADSAEPKSIQDISNAGFWVEPARKGADSIKNSIDKLQTFNLHITKHSLNLIKELRNYKWAKDREGKALNAPEDCYNHCFIGSTLITTINGLKRIDEISIGDLVLSSQGYKPVLKVFNNGVQQVNNYLIQCGTLFVSLTCTENHKIKTDKAWIKIKDLKLKQTLYLHKHSMVKNISYIQKKDILEEVIIGCMLLFGNFTITKKYLKDFMYTTKTIIRSIIHLQILKLKKLISILANMGKIDLRIIPNGQKIFIKKELQPLQYGINQKKVLSGIDKMQSNATLDIKHLEKESAKCVTQNIQQIQIRKDFVETTANLNIEDMQDLIMLKENAKNANQSLQSINIQEQKIAQIIVQESYSAKVYDLMVADCHEYFANGVLVHNCTDALRYVALNKLNNYEGTYSFGD